MTQVPNRQRRLGIKRSNKTFKTDCMWRLGSCVVRRLKGRVHRSATFHRPGGCIPFIPTEETTTASPYVVQRRVSSASWDHLPRLFRVVSWVHTQSQTLRQRPKVRVLSWTWRSCLLYQERRLTLQGCALSRDQSRVSLESEPRPHQPAKTRASFLRSPKPCLHCRWKPRLNHELSTAWVYYSWPYPIKTTKDCISINSQGVQLESWVHLGIKSLKR